MGGRIITGSINCSDIIVNKDLITEYSNSNTAITDGTKELEVSVNRREYNIVGDELYIPKRYEDAPQWLRDIIDTVTSAALSGALSDVSTLGDMLDGLIAELNVAKNTYTMSIISDNSINERINTAIETLNSSLAESDSTILNIALTRVTPEQAQAIAIGVLSASINGGDIAAAVQNLQSAIADVDSARALDYTRLTAQIGDGLEDEATARAEAISYLTTGVSNINGTLTTQAGQITALQTSASTVDSRIATAKSDVTSTLNTTITNGDIAVQSKWAYNSVISVNGVYKKSGFGLTTNYTSGAGTEANPYVSEFWIDASRLKFTNSAMTGRTAPFTIDASGITPQIKFNGKVSFTDVTDVPSLGTSSNNLLTNSAPTLGNETYGWQVGWYNTNIVPNAVASGFDVWRPTGAGSVYVVVGGSPTVGTVFDIRQSNNIPVVAGKRYEISALLSSHRCTSVCTLAFFNSAGTYISEIGAGTANSAAYSGDLSNWVRKGGFVTVPAGTSYAQFYIRSAVTGTDPYCFVAQAYVGEVPNDKTEFSSWSEGTSANSTIAWQSEVQVAINNNATYIDGGKIVTNTALVNNLNAVGGVVADYVNANEFNGMTFNGGIFNGARINGAVIKASYLDLDGELKALTNYHISVATRNSNPSLYRDAVYISADNEYRIPSISRINESVVLKDIASSDSSYNSIIRSYNCSNAGHNTKCVSINPVVTVPTFVFFRMKFVRTDSSLSGTRIVGKSQSFTIYFAGVSLGTFYFNYPSNYLGTDYGFYRNETKIMDGGGETYNISVNGFTFAITFVNTSTSNTETKECTFSILSSDTNLASNFTDVNKGLFYIYNNGGSTLAPSGNCTVAATYQAVMVNTVTIYNMI